MATEWEVFYLKNWSYEDIAGTSKFPHFHPFSAYQPMNIPFSAY
jgi:hypothetical protein